MKTNNQQLHPIYIVWALFGSLAVWGLYLAVGATGFFSPAHDIDFRKFIVVFLCSAAFLGFWYTNLLIKKRLKSESGDEGKNSDKSLACWFSLISSIIGYVVWGIAYATRGPAVTILGYVSAALISTSVIAAIIGLSNPQPQKGKWLGLVSLVLFMLSIILFFAQVYFYFKLRGGN